MFFKGFLIVIETFKAERLNATSFILITSDFDEINVTFENFIKNLL